MADPFSMADDLSSFETVTKPDIFDTNHTEPQSSENETGLNIALDREREDNNLISVGEGNELDDIILEPQTVTSKVPQDQALLLDFESEGESKGRDTAYEVSPSEEQNFATKVESLLDDITPTAPEQSEFSGQFEMNEATPPPSPPPSPIESKPAVDVEPVDEAPLSASKPTALIADSTTSAPSSDDRPVKMPKATTIATPTKAAVARSSNSCSAGCPTAWLKQVDPRVWDLLLWRDPRVTGAALAVIMLVLLPLACYSVFSIVSYMMLLTLIAAIMTRLVKAFLVKVHKGDDVHPFKEILDADISVSEALVEEYSQVIVQRFNQFIAELRDLILVKDFFSSLKLGLVLYAATYIGAWFNGLTVVILGVVAAFTLPKVYEVNKSQIDHYVEMAQSRFEDTYKQLQDKVPFLKKQKTQ